MKELMLFTWVITIVMTFGSVWVAAADEAANAAPAENVLAR